MCKHYTLRLLPVIILLALMPCSAWATIALAQNCVNANSGATASGTAASPSITTTIHNAVIVGLFKDGSTAANTQTTGDTLTQRVNIQGSGERNTLYTNYDVAGGATVYTFTFTSTNWRIFVCEFSGLDTTQTTPDVTGTTAFVTATTNRVVATASTTNANDLLFAAWFGDGSGSDSITSTIGDDTVAWTRPTGGFVITGGNQEFVTAYEVVSATATYGVTLTVGTSISANATLIGLKAAASSTMYTRTFTDATDGNASEVSSRIRSANVSTNDAATPGPSETMARTEGFIRGPTDLPSSFEANVRAFTGARSVRDASLSLADIKVNGVIHTVSVVDASFSSSDISARVLAYTRSDEADGTLSDAPVRVYSGARSATDAFGYNNQPGNNVNNYLALMYESIGIGDVAARVLVLARPVYDSSISSSDLRNRAFSGSRSLSDTVFPVNDNILKGHANSVSVSDAFITISDSRGRIYNTFKQFTDVSAVSELRARVLTMSRSDTEPAPAVDSNVATYNSFTNVLSSRPRSNHRR